MKLSISSPDDPCEREADDDRRSGDANARANNRKPVRRGWRASQTSRRKHNCAAYITQPEAEALQQTVQTKNATNQSGTASTNVESAVNSIQGGGQPLDRATRAFYEPRFGHDFSQVKVHTHAQAEKSAKDVNARAFTVGQNIAFAAGQFQPQSENGRTLLAHELTHTIQQGHGRQNNVQKMGREPHARSGAEGQEIEDTIHAVELALSIAQRRDQAQDNFDSNNSHLNQTKLTKIHNALTGTVGENPHLLISFYDYYSNKEILEASASQMSRWGEGAYARTESRDDTYVRPSLLADEFPSLTLGGLLIHEYTHTRHNINFVGASSYEEGDSYGIEYFFAQRNNDARRIQELRNVMHNPIGRVLGNQASALRELFCKSYGTMKVLYEIIDGGSTTHASLAELRGLTSDQARVLSTELVARRRSRHSGGLARIVTWVWTNRASLQMPFRCS